MIIIIISNSDFTSSLIQDHVHLVNYGPIWSKIDAAFLWGDYSLQQHVLGYSVRSNQELQLHHLISNMVSSGSKKTKMVTARIESDRAEFFCKPTLNLA